jgi:CRISPR-associated protein Cmr3
MILWLINPRDPLIFRDGKPFTAEPGARAKSLHFPYPSTIIGAVRTMAGIDPQTGEFDKRLIPELLRKSIRGPFLVELDDTDKIKDWLFPAPVDALLMKAAVTKQVKRLWLHPIATPSGILTNQEPPLAVLGPAQSTNEKPHPHPPRFWHWNKYMQWLEAPDNDQVTLFDLGHDGPQLESRMHVSIAPGSQTALPGALFQTSGLEFMYINQDEDAPIYLDGAPKLGLVVATDAELSEGLGFLGGERRIARWQQVDDAVPVCPDNIRQDILRDGACRLVLVTSAYFEKGYLPDWVLETYGAELFGAAVHRYQTISGWDYDVGKPKPTRRLAPAGSVYFLKLNGEHADIHQFIDAVWMQTISDGEQERRDGFGLAALGTWDGNLGDMEVKHD